MIILGKTKRVATGVAIALVSSLVFVSPAFAQDKPADKPAPAAPAKPAGDKPADKPAGDKPADKPAGDKPADKPAAPAKPVDAKAAFASGEKKFKAADYAGALADFEASNTAKADVAALRYIAVAHDNLGHYAEAVAAYEKFVAEAATAKKMNEEVDQAKKRVEALKATPGVVNVVTVPEGASIVLDGAQTPYEKTTPTAISLPPGKHKLLVGAEGYENSNYDVDVTFASKQEVKIELTKKAPPPPPPPVVAEQPAAPQPPPPPPPPEPRSKVPAYVTGGVAIVAAGVGTVFGLKALSDSSDFKDKPTTKTADDGENNALVADMMFGIAITFGVTSAVLFLSNDSPSSAKGKLQRAASAPKKAPLVKFTPAPYVNQHGGGFGGLFQF